MTDVTDEPGTNSRVREMPELRALLAAEIGAVRTDMASLENRLTLRVGRAIAASTALLAAVVSLQ